MSQTLILLRHGQSIWNLENLFTGWTDVGLTEKGGGGEERRTADDCGGSPSRRPPHISLDPSN